MVVSENKFQIVKFLLQIFQKLEFSEVAFDLNIIDLEGTEHLLQNKSLSFVVLDDQHFIDVFFVLNSFEALQQDVLIERLAEEIVVCDVLSPKSIVLRVVS